MGARSRTARLERERRGWSQYAAQHGFRHRSETTHFSLRVHHRLDGEFEGIPLSCATGLGILGMPTTTVSTRASVPIDGRLYVSRTEAFSLGQDDSHARRVRTTGTPIGDGAFVVHATHPDLVKCVLIDAVREALVRLSASGRQSINFRCDRDLLTVEWLGIEALPELLDLASRLLLVACRSRLHAGAYR